MAIVGAYRPFAIGHDDIKELAGITVTSKEIQRVSCQIGKDINKFYEKEIPDNIIPFSSKATMYLCMDGTGVPVIKNETKGRKGKHKDGIAKTREAKLGCVFTQTSVDKDGYPVRDELSTSYIGSIETSEAFGDRLYAEARIKELDRDKVEKVIAALEKLSPPNEKAKESLQREIGYFEKNKKRMRYKTFKNQGFFIGSGVIEAGYRAVIGQRLKQSGMHWSVKNANKIIALRCYILSNYWEDFWGSRACA